MPAVLDKILKAGEGKILKKLKNVAKQVNSIETDFQAMSDAELRQMTDEFRQRLAAGESLDDLMPEAFATVREAAQRTIGLRHFDVQIMGGAALHWGNISEMKTGEGKTLVATLPLYLNALTGKGVHLVTVNDYLAKHQGEMMGRIFHFLGLTTGVLLNHMNSAERREVYAADITYGTNNEFGFDYLRDNMAWRREEMVQRGHHFVIVDEVDSILIDEARTPLVISGPAEGSSKWYGEFAKLVARMRPDYDYEVDIKKRTVGVLEPAIDKVEDYLGIENLYESENTPLVQFLNNAIKAKELFKRDKDYVIIDGEVLIVDEHTGRVLAGRRFNEGLHQALEAKEEVEIKDENQTLASITLQNFFRMYDKLAGMTGTAMTEASEFHKIYKLGVVPIPTNKPMVREDRADLIYRTEQAKFDAVVKDIAGRHAKGQPVLVGTTSVEQSERLSGELKKAGVRHEVLNAKQHAREAAIIAQAGRRGAVTVATNMAGRGTDIILGGNAEFLADLELRNNGLDPVEHPEEYERAWRPTLERLERATEAEHDAVAAVGGLYVLGTARHDSRRIDNQLRGRAGRQGDPGESRFYLSLEDELLRRFKADWVDWVLTSMNVPDDQPIEHKRVSNTIASAQAAVEAMNFEQRKDVLKYDDVMNRQRQVVYAERQRVLEGDDVHDQVLGMIDETVRTSVASVTDGFPEDWNLEQLWKDLRYYYPVQLDLSRLEAEHDGRDRLSEEILVKALQDDARQQYIQKERIFGHDGLRDMERQAVLQVLDQKWREHLYEMDYLRDGIGLRAMAQRDPLVEYQREGFDLFQTMMESIKEETVSLVFRAEPPPEPSLDPSSPVAQAVAQNLGAPQRPRQLSYSAPTVDNASGVMQQTEGGNGQRRGAGAAGRSGATGGPGRSAGTPTTTVTKSDDPYAGVSRNAPCPCGSGKKFKFCHGARS